MKKISTPIQPQIKSANSHNVSPRISTIAILRQFARVYRPAPAIGMPGIILN